MRTLSFVIAFLLVAAPVLGQEQRLLLVTAPGEPDTTVTKLVGAVAEGRSPLPVEIVTSDDLPGLALPIQAPLLVLVGADSELLWYSAVQNPEAAFASLREFLAPGEGLIRSAGFQTSSDEPLEQGHHVLFDVWGAEGGQATATIGGQQVTLHESPPGHYQGFYLVGPEDRTVASMSVTLAAGGETATRELGQVALQGLRLPRITTVEHYDVGVWRFTGTAPANSTVTGELEIEGVGHGEVSAQADEHGVFQNFLRIGTWFSPREGTFHLRATTADNEVVASPQTMPFESKVAYRPLRIYPDALYGAGWGVGLGWGNWFPYPYYPWPARGWICR